MSRSGTAPAAPMSPDVVALIRTPARDRPGPSGSRDVTDPATDRTASRTRELVRIRPRRQDAVGPRGDLDELIGQDSPHVRRRRADSGRGTLLNRGHHTLRSRIKTLVYLSGPHQYSSRASRGPILRAEAVSGAVELGEIHQSGVGASIEPTPAESQRFLDLRGAWWNLGDAPLVCENSHSTRGRVRSVGVSRLIDCRGRIPRMWWQACQ